MRQLSWSLPRRWRNEMECSRCGSHNIQTFQMAHASNNVGINSWGRVVKLALFGPLGLFMKHNRNSLARATSPPEKPFPVLALVVTFLFLCTLIWLVNVYLRDGLGDGETQTALLVNVVLFAVTAIIVLWDVNRCIKAKRKYPERFDNWIHSWICLQCGTTYKLIDVSAT